jgi:uncharacterized protein (DUF433 family)
MKLMATIISDPEIMMGKPVVAGTRITVELILEKLAAGETTTQILAAHPHLTRDGTWRHWAFAAEALRAHVVHTPIAILPRQSQSVRIRRPRGNPNI